MGGLDWLRGEYEFRKREAESHVVEWRNYSDEIFDPRPLYFESHRRRPGRRVGPEATFPVARYQYGFGQDGRVWVEREATQFRGQIKEMFVVYGSDGPAEAAQFDHSSDKRPIYLDRFTYADGLLVKYEKQGQMGCVRSTYLYSEGHPTRIDHHTGPSLEQLVPFQIEHLRFDGSGKLAEVVCRQLDPAGREVASEVRFKAKPRAMTTKDAVSGFLNEFAAAVPSALSSAHVTGPVYCLALAYDPEQFSTLPPTVALGFVDHLGQPDSEPWNPAKMGQIELEREQYPELFKFAELLDQRPLSAKALRSLMNEAALRLAKLDFSGILALSPDFVVYATDLDLGDLIPNLRRVLSKDRFEQLQRSGTLPD